MNREPVIGWFRDDLRLADNPAFTASVKSGLPVLPVYFGAPWKSIRGSPVPHRADGYTLPSQPGSIAACEEVVRRGLYFSYNLCSFLYFKSGGGGGSRTRVRNRSQQRDSMLSRVPEGFALCTQNGQDAHIASPWFSLLWPVPSHRNQPAVRRPSAAHRRSCGGRLLS